MDWWVCSFLALVFAVNYAFEHKLISPRLQVAFEYLVALAVLGGGLVIHRRRLAVLAQTLCATGVLMLYAVTFAGRAYYHLIGTAPGFAVMVAITAVAFWLAVRLDAQVVAVLGLVGGFLTRSSYQRARIIRWALYLPGFVRRRLDCGRAAETLELSGAARCCRHGVAASELGRDVFHGGKVDDRTDGLPDFRPCSCSGSWWRNAGIARMIC